MTKLEIYNMARYQFGMEAITSDDISAGTEREVVIMTKHYNQALLGASLDANWSFLNSLVAMSSDDDGGEKAGWKHSYTLPSDINRLVDVWGADGSKDVAYRRVGSTLLTNAETPYVVVQYTDYIEPDSDELPIPEEFWMLVALRLAYLCIPALRGADTAITQIVLTEYNALLTTLKLHDAQGGAREFDIG